MNDMAVAERQIQRAKRIAEAIKKKAEAKEREEQRHFARVEAARVKKEAARRRGAQRG